MKKLFLISVAIFALTAGAAAYYYFYIKAPQSVQNTVVDQGYKGNPFGDTTFGINEPTEPVASTTEDGRIIIPLQTLTQIYKDPVAGATIVSGTKTTNVRFVDRGSGHIYEFDTDTGILSTLTNTTVPKIQNAVWLDSGKTVAMQYLADDDATVTSYSAKLILPSAKSADTTGSLQGSFLPNNIGSMAANPTGKRIAFQVRSANSSRTVLANQDGTKSVSLFTSPISHWHVSWPTEAVITLNSAPSSQSAGFLYFLNQNGGLRKILGGIRGLTTLTDAAASTVLFSDSNNALVSHTIKTRTEKNMGVSTLAEKCVWSKRQKNTAFCAVPTQSASNMPDAWYKGTVSFTDRLYKINTATGDATLLADIPEIYRRNFDMINPTLSPKENFLIFINKKDLSLWSLQLDSVQ